MNYLVDTHAVIWFITADKKLPQATKSIIEDETNNCFVSIATFWEIGIKYSLGRLDLQGGLNDIFDIILDSGFSLLPITPQHIVKNSDLEFHHQDPFDRLIIAQAIVEGLKVISKDQYFKNYDIEIVWK